MQKKIIALVLLAVGIALFIWGYNMTQSIGEEVRETLTGTFSDKATWLMIGGGALGLIGILQLAFGKK
ncbi:DUF3185 family protein [Kangiella koreensis]|uniref:Membrane protein n=1 Tax=Kangiella koreensis (strain DSM 16069 / JCM 12317 / KCTC 12182 / SW-125) TaxID=523791 RepID=C7RAV0_KANKD|nr:DUF3185 family protein [Kangiella koreensis]ACV26392.1 membrane protein [Kangiella koreensis DSM 16069]